MDRDPRMDQAFWELVWLPVMRADLALPDLRALLDPGQQTGCLEEDSRFQPEYFGCSGKWKPAEK
jgi:hypothetical protein